MEADKLTKEEREYVENHRTIFTAMQMQIIIDRLAPKPAPPTTPGRRWAEAHIGQNCSGINFRGYARNFNLVLKHDDMIAASAKWVAEFMSSAVDAERAAAKEEERIELITIINNWVENRLDINFATRMGPLVRLIGQRGTAEAAPAPG